MLREAEQRAVGVLEEHRDVLDAQVQLLLSYETVDGSEVYALAHRPEPVGGEGMTGSTRSCRWTGQWGGRTITIGQWA
jgi:hypothetical protein